MSREEQEENFNILKFQQGLKEYIFMTRSGYRHFFVLGKDLKEAERDAGLSPTSFTAYILK